MPRFLVIMKQEGDGCDHMIGCGVRLETVDAESVAAAAVRLRAEWTGEDGPGYLGLDEYSESALAAAWIVPWVDVLAVPFASWASAERVRRARQVIADEEQNARELLGDLKARFES